MAGTAIEPSTGAAASQGALSTEAQYIIAGTSTSNDGKLVPGVRLVGDDGKPIGAISTSGTPVPLSSPPSATNAGSATALHFAADINHLYILNQSVVTVGVAWRVGVTASPGSAQVPAGQPLVLDVNILQANGISLYTASAVNINGSTGGNLVVEGAS